MKKRTIKKVNQKPKALRIMPLQAVVAVAGLLIAGFLLGQHLPSSVDPSQAAVEWGSTSNDPIVVNPSLLYSITCTDGTMPDEILDILKHDGWYMSLVRQWQDYKVREVGILDQIEALDPTDPNYQAKLEMLQDQLRRIRDLIDKVLVKIHDIEGVILSNHGCSAQEIIGGS